MKVDGITLLQMIRDGKIKDGTKISCSDFVSSYYFKSGTLGYYNKDENGIIKFVELSLKDIIENIKYATYEIIEEIEKPKDIQKLTICGKDIGYGVMEEWLDFPPYQNEKKICSAIEQIAINQNKIIEAVNYLLKKEDDK